MSGPLLTTIAGFALVLLAVAAIPVLGARLRLPVATLQAALGIALGSLILLAGDAAFPDAGEGLMQPLEAVLDALAGLGAQGVLALFLPPLLFDAALRVDTRRLIADFAPVLLLAIVAVVLTTGLVGVGVAAVTDLPLLWAVLLGALVATTDPSAVLGAFREVGAPRRLQALVEGESLLNDAAAIVLFVALGELLVSGASPEPTAVVGQFTWSFLGGAGLGALAGGLAAVVVARLRFWPDAALTVSLALPYLAFVGAEQHLGVSGVVAVVLAGLVLGRALQSQVPPALEAQILALWGQLANWAGALIVVGATLLMPNTLRADVFDPAGLAAVVLGCLLARSLILWGVLPLLVATRITAPIDHRFRLATLWGGLRGAVTVALALTVAADQTLDADLRGEIAVLACAFVLVTLFVQAPTLPLLLRRLGLGGLSRLDRVLRERASRTVALRLRERIAELSARLGLDIDEETATALVVASDSEVQAGETERRDRLIAAVASLTERESDRYRDLFDAGVIGPIGATTLLDGARTLTEALTARGLAAYVTAAKDELAYGWRLRLYQWLYRRLRWRRPLAVALSLRYERVLVRRAVLTRLRRDVVDELRTLLDDDSADRVDKLLGARLDGHQKTVEGLRRQYPQFARALEKRFLQLATSRLERDAYRELRGDGLLSGAAFADLNRQVVARRRLADPLPSLDLRVDRAALLARVPFVEGLDPRTRRRLLRTLRPGLALPGDRLIRRGATGDSLYFIADGAVVVQWPGGRRTLGSGEVFGEIAVVTGQRRTADVTALTYVQYLRLARDDYLRAIERSATFRRSVADLAYERSAEQLETQTVSRGTRAPDEA